MCTAAAVVCATKCVRIVSLDLIVVSDRLCAKEPVPFALRFRVDRCSWQGFDCGGALGLDGPADVRFSAAKTPACLHEQLRVGVFAVGFGG